MADPYERNEVQQGIKLATYQTPTNQFWFCFPNDVDYLAMWDGKSQDLTSYRSVIYRYINSNKKEYKAYRKIPSSDTLNCQRIMIAIAFKP